MKTFFVQCHLEKTNGSMDGVFSWEISARDPQEVFRMLNAYEAGLQFNPDQRNYRIILDTISAKRTRGIDFIPFTIFS